MWKFLENGDNLSKETVKKANKGIKVSFKTNLSLHKFWIVGEWGSIVEKLESIYEYDQITVYAIIQNWQSIFLNKTEFSNLKEKLIFVITYFIHVD